ncbi:hypothetical protein OH76DRAFT_1404133 [Lentinus brumalis]|uniref:Uncharacterized protein n=1 Tax=Lentinus brumalis TaxID=2498619 RepID=A0A371D8T0_9APHY|nr:hypothetical protein OH76DRAFT_1404133 [Polyporus brumalis]
MTIAVTAWGLRSQALWASHQGWTWQVVKTRGGTRSRSGHLSSLPRLLVNACLDVRFLFVMDLAELSLSSRYGLRGQLRFLQLCSMPFKAGWGVSATRMTMVWCVIGEICSSGQGGLVS